MDQSFHQKAKFDKGFCKIISYQNYHHFEKMREGQNVWKWNDEFSVGECKQMFAKHNIIYSAILSSELKNKATESNIKSFGSLCGSEIGYKYRYFFQILLK